MDQNKDADIANVGWYLLFGLTFMYLLKRNMKPIPKRQKGCGFSLKAKTKLNVTWKRCEKLIWDSTGDQTERCDEWRAPSRVQEVA